MDGEQNIRRSTGDGEAGVENGQPGSQGVDGNGAGGGDGAGSIGGGGAGGSVPAGGDASGGDQPTAAAPAGRIGPGGGDDGSDELALDWKNNESDAEAAITWARYHAGDQTGKAIRILTTLAENQELGIRNGDTPVRNNAKTALRDVLAQVG